MYDFERYFRIRVERVKDGDTLVVSFYLGLGIWLNDQPVRLVGINTPETKGEEKPQGLAVKTFMEKLVAEAEDMIVRTDEEKKGKYGRFLVTLLARKGDKWYNVNELLLKRGAAKEYMAADKSQVLTEIFNPPAPTLEKRIVVDEPRTEEEVYNKTEEPRSESEVAEEIKEARRDLKWAVMHKNARNRRK